MTGVYLSNDMIQTVKATRHGNRVEVEQVYTQTLPEGCVLGGRIMEQDVLAEQLKKLSADKVLSSSLLKISADMGAMGIKLVSLPGLSSEKYMRRLIAESFHESTDAIYDYKTLGRNNDGTLNVLACRAERGLIKGYIDAFSSAGFRIRSLEPAVCGLIRLVQFSKMLCTSSFAVISVDAGCISRYIFTDGIYRFGGRDRVFAKRSDSGFLNELVRVTASVRLSEYSVTNLLFCGASSSELEYVRSTLNDPQLKMAEFPDLPEVRFVNGGRLSEYVFAVGTVI